MLNPPTETPTATGGASGNPLDQPVASGAVCLIGAGPGDAGLITVAGLERLRRADVVVYDALANPRLLREAPAGAERVDVGKRARAHTMKQPDINQLLVDRARAGRFVVRLKGGDPYLFGRGAEECAFCARHGVACEVVPGVTSGIAAPAAAGIPVTHRRVASTVTLVTGHEDPTKPETSVDYAGLATLIRTGGTVCFYMGVGRLPVIGETLQQHGVRADLPVAVVQWGTLPKQRSCRGTLVSIADELERTGVSSPAIIVVGEAAGIDEPGLDYFTDAVRRPLFGLRVGVTRTRQQSSRLVELLEQAGAEVLEAPTIDVVPMDPEAWLDALLREAGWDHLVLTSPNAVHALADGLDARGTDARGLAGVCVSVVGEATAAALHARLRVRADFQPADSSGAAIGRELAGRGDVAGRRFLLIRADIARPDLPRVLHEAGAAEVHEAVAYQTRPVEALDAGFAAALAEKNLDWLLFTSSSTFDNLWALSDAAQRDGIRAARLASMGTRTSASITAAGCAVAAEPDVPTLENLVAAVAAVAKAVREENETDG